MRIYGFTQYGDASAQGYLETADPVPGPGQLLVEMTAAGVNPADVKVRSGMRRGQVPVSFPMAMGREAAGVVVSLGDGVAGFQRGQRVFGQVAPGTGAFAERVLLDAASSAVVPDGVEDAQACCIPVSVGAAVLADAVALLAGGPRSVSAAAPAAAVEMGGSVVQRRRTTAVFARLAGLVAAADLSPLIGARFSFDRAADAVATVESGHAAGNVVLER